MRNEIIENREFYIISRNVDNAEKCKITEVCEDRFKVKLKNKRKYEVDESIEMFAMTLKGQLFFDTIVKEVNDDIISVWFPISSKYLQRREYSRIKVDKELILYNNSESIDAWVSDLSAGGLKIITREQLHLLKEYPITINVENRRIETKFQPIRIEAFDEGFISSGRFTDIDNYDRIALVQYCFRKHIESNNI